MYTQEELSTRVALNELRIEKMESNFESYVKSQKEENTEFHKLMKDRDEKMDNRMSRVEKVIWTGGGGFAVIMFLIEVYKTLKH